MLNPNQALPYLAADAKKHLQDNLKVQASLVAAATGRVNLNGEHIDYCDDFVFPLAIERYVVIAARPNDSHIARIGTEGQDAIEIDLSTDPLLKQFSSLTLRFRFVIESAA